ncbi:MAG: hypothetical protein EXR22_06175 [Flavobacteriaceae bacterium]|nr:hypothetical protein [Flavobacteriaceae bacterium]PHX83847.1 MAG: hypothetical protein CK537_03700 [Flavobacteriales bacterium]
MIFPLFTELGFFHILDAGAWDHLLFVAAMMAPFSIKDVKMWFLALSSFTVGHSLAMAAQIALALSLNSALIEGLVLATLVFTAGRVVWFKGAPKTSRGKWFSAELLLAACFGLVHGLAFAKDLAPLLPASAEGLWASWGWFALGIEGGQLLVVAAVFSLKWMASVRGFNPRDFALALGAICLGVSLHLASQWYLEL